MSAPESPPGGVASGRSPVPEGTTTREAGVGDLRASLAEMVAAIRESHEPDSEIVDALLAAGWVKAPDDWQAQLEQAYAEGEADAERRLLALRGGAR